MNSNCELYYGDNLTIIKKLPSDHIDLIYLDPPFNSNRSYNMMYKNKTGYPVPEQVEAFCDTWNMDEEKIELMENMRDIMDNYNLDANFINFWDLWIKALRQTQPKLLAYLLYMTPRLLEMRRILKQTGSIYLHCDPTASHYIKIIMDGIFSHKNFRNEIVWSYSGNSKPKKDFPRKHDILLRFTKSNNPFFQPITLKYKESTLKRYNHKDENGRRYKISALRDGKKENIYMSDGVYCTDVYTDIPVERSKLRLGYPTQKPIKLLDRIIKSSCPEDGIVLDPFCGCGTSIYSAHLLNKKWIGIDIAIHSVNLVKETLLGRYSLREKEHYKIDGIPVSVEQAKELFKKDPFQFEKWVVEEVKGFCTQKTNDKGIDGRIYFQDGGLQNMVISVKGGKSINPSMVRDLKGVIEREKSSMGGLILMNEPTKGMKKEASKSGYYKSAGINYAKFQILTIKEILEEKKLFHIPNIIGHKEKKNDQYFQPDLKPIKYLVK